MSDERELKLKCYQAGGTIEEAQRLYDWVVERDAMLEALQWCSASEDFQRGGQARLGWLKLCAPLLDPSRDDSEEIATLEAQGLVDPTKGGEDCLDSAIAALEAPAQPHGELRSVPPATEEESGGQIEASSLQTEETTAASFGGDDQGEVHEPPPGGVEESRDQSEDFTLLDPAVLRDEQDGVEAEPEGYAPVVDAEPVLDATELAQVTIDKVPPTAEVIKDQTGRAKFALFGGQTHEVVEPSNTEADFWARALFPKKKEQA